MPDGSTASYRAVSWQSWNDGREVGMRRIIEANIKRFNELLKIEADPAKLEVLTGLVADEKEKLKQPEVLKTKAY
jgi:hypothetical protein